MSAGRAHASDSPEPAHPQTGSAEERPGAGNAVSIAVDAAAREAVEASERRFRALAEGTSDIVWRTDPQGRISVDSPSWRVFTGQTREQWLASRGYEAIHPDDVQGVERAWRDAVASRRPFDVEYRLRRHDGVYRPMAVRGTPVLDDAGEVLEWIGTNHDISDRIEREREREALLRSERAARAEAEAARRRMGLLDRITSQLVTRLPSGRLTLQGLSELLVPDLADWCAVYVPRPDGAIGVAAVAHSDPALVEAARQFLERYPVRPELAWGVPLALRTGEPQLFERLSPELLATAALDEEHERMLLQANIHSLLVVPMQAEGRVVGALSLTQTESDRSFTAEDLTLAMEIGGRAAFLLEQTRLLEETERARAEAEAASRAKDEFVALLGHELRNPLSPIVTALELMRMRDDSVFRREREIIDRQVSHMRRLVDDLLDLSRIARGVVELRRRPVPVADAISRAVEASAALFEQRQHVLDVDVPADLAIDGDPERLTQIFSNVLVNAARYTPSRGRVQVRATAEADAVVVRIQDDGQGIEPDLLPRVFDVFTQGPRKLDRAEGGLGIGLSIVGRLVALHGGDVRLTSEGSGRGTLVTVRLPRASAGAPGSSRPTEGSTLALPAASRDRVLVVDDNQDAAELLAEFVQELGFDVARAHDGPTALEAALRTPPAIVLLDLGLPVMDGYEIAERLRQLLGERSPVLIALTGYGQASDVTRSERSGFRHHLTKPVDLERLAALLAASRPSVAR